MFKIKNLDKLSNFGQSLMGRISKYFLPVGVILVGVGVFGQVLTLPSWSSFEIGDPDGQSFIDSNFPIIPAGSKSGSFNIRTDLQVGDFGQKTFHFYNDNCLESLKINNQVVNLKSLSSTQTPCDINYGQDFDLSKYLKTGKNKVEVVVTNTGGGFMFRVTGSWFDPQFAIYTGLILLGLICLFAWICKRLKFSSGIVFSLISGLAVRIYYWSHTSYIERVYDLVGHDQYFEIINQENRIPALLECWQCYHPPFFYIQNTIIFKIWNFFIWNFRWSLFQIDRIKRIEFIQMQDCPAIIFVIGIHHFEFGAIHKFIERVGCVCGNSRTEHIVESFYKD